MTISSVALPNMPVPTIAARALHFGASAPLRLCAAYLTRGPCLIVLPVVTSCFTLGLSEGRVARVGRAPIHQWVKAWQTFPFATTGPLTDVRPESCASTIIEAAAHDR